MSPRLRTLLELVRLPNLFTAPPDVIAGACLAGVIHQTASWLDAVVVGILGLASMHLYAGGVALNDVLDAGRDARERPERPIPSGRIDRRTALRIALALLLAGCILAWGVSRWSGVAGVAIATSAALYDLAKTRWFSPILMGLCRALNMALGLLAAQRLPDLPQTWPCVCLGVYVAGVTLYARRETSPGFRHQRVIGLVCVVSALIGLIPLLTEGWQIGVVPLLAILATAAVAGLRGAINDRPAQIQQAVVSFILGIVLLDAWLAWMSAGWRAGGAVLLFAVPFVVLAPKLRPT